MENVINIVGPYLPILKLIIEVILIYILFLVCKDAYKKWKNDREESNKIENKVRLTAGEVHVKNDADRITVIKNMLSPDGVDPSPNSYMCISDGGKEVYVRCITLEKLPKKVRYAETFKGLLEFPNCSCTTFVEPISSEELESKIDKQINVLEQERYSNAGNTNRVRKLANQESEVEAWADKVETGDKKFFNVGWLFMFTADSVEELNKTTDTFRSMALNKKIDISNCYAVQSEAFLSTLPLNRRHRFVFKKLNSDCIKMHLMDEGAVSVILNYTTDYFSHKKGVPLGRNLFNCTPFTFDLFHPSHDGFSCVIAGKTGSGKSATIKIFGERAVPLGYRFVIIDSQSRKGASEGEYAAFAEINGGVNYQISSSTVNTLNIFDVQETKEFIKQSASSGYERDTLDLNSAITDMVYNLRSMMQIGATDEDRKMDAVMDSDIEKILKSVLKEAFTERGIVHGDAESLYEAADVVQNGMLQSGSVPKKLPTLTDVFVKILEEKRDCREENLSKAYRLIINNLEDYVRELYYSEDSVTLFTRDEYLGLPENPDKRGSKIYEHGAYRENVIALKGIRPYFDGQSSFKVSKDCPVTNIDISQLTENERKIAREIAIRFVNEQFIKKNSETSEGSDKLVVICDECHENFEFAYGRKTFANVSRTARKRHVSILFCSQSIKEYSRFPETEDILKQAAVKIIFKQDAVDMEHLEKALNITASQAYIITNTIGVVNDKDDEEAKNRHRGECCLIDGEQVLFLKVDYLRRTEALSVETDATTVMQKLMIG